jgi:hypothetical protein
MSLPFRDLPTIETEGSDAAPTPVRLGSPPNVKARSAWVRVHSLFAIPRAPASAAHDPESLAGSGLTEPVVEADELKRGGLALGRDDGRGQLQAVGHVQGMHAEQALGVVRMGSAGRISCHASASARRRSSAAVTSAIDRAPSRSGRASAETHSGRVPHQTSTSRSRPSAASRRSRAGSATRSGTMPEASQNLTAPLGVRREEPGAHSRLAGAARFGARREEVDSEHVVGALPAQAARAGHRHVARPPHARDARRAGPGPG